MKLMFDQQTLRGLCQDHDITRLYLVGSMARGDAQDQSDIDLLVTFRPGARPLEQYFDAKDAFERVFGRTIDLIEEGAIANAVVQQNLHQEKVLIYEA